MTMLSGSTAAGAVYDRGYRPYAGQRGGRSAARWAMVRLTVRRALGIRRSWRQKVLPWLLLALVTIPAMVNVGIRYATRDTAVTDLEIQFISYRDQVGISNLLLVFVAIVAPDVICPDRRNRMLPLIFARPLTGVDYVLAKVAALFAVLFAFSMVPQVVLFVGQMVVSKDGSLDYLSDNADILWKVPASVALVALFLAVVGAAASSVTDRRLVAGAGILGVALITGAVATIITGERQPWDDGNAAALINIFGVPLHIRDMIFLGHIDPGSSLGGVEGGGMMSLMIYVAVLAFSSSLLLLRYQEVKL